MGALDAARGKWGRGAPGREGARTAFRQEGNRLLLAAPSFHIAFSLAAKGALVSLWNSRAERELIYSLKRRRTVMCGGSAWFPVAGRG